MACLNRCLLVANARVIYFRRTFPELSLPGGVIDRALAIVPREFSDGTPVYKYLKTDHKFIFFNGSEWTFAHMQHESDKTHYQSSQVDMVVFDELTHFLESMYTFFANSRVRVADGRTFGIRIAATNPGSVGHMWVKTRFVDVTDSGEIYVDDEGNRRVFIPATLDDNEILMKNDPKYEKSLNALPEADMKALRHGDWEAYAGQFFSEWSRRVHVIKPFDIPAHWPRSSGYDFGYGAAAVHLWFAVDPATGLVYCYREYATVRWLDGGKFESYKATLSEQAHRIKDYEREAKEPPLEWRAADPSIFGVTQANTGEAPSESFDNLGVHFEKSDNARVAGAMRCHAWLTHLVERDEHGEPAKDESGNIIPICDEHGPIAPLRFFDTCRYMTTTIPSLPHDPKNPNDVDTHAEEHGYDAWRMWAMHRPEPVNLTPFRFTRKKPPNRKAHWSEIEDGMYDDDTPDVVRGLLTPHTPQRRRFA